MKNIFILIRPQQYIKNLFIFLPLFFAGQITDANLLFRVFVAFVAFSAVASAVYIFNDYHDIKADQQHPRKRNRPLALGLVSKKNAIVLMIVLAVIGVCLMATLSWMAVMVLVIYILLNIAYSFFLKHIAILDIITVAIGFVLRLFVGAIVTGILLSSWIVIMTFLLALFIALAKRRDDILLFLDTKKITRKVVEGYSLKFIDGSMLIMASVVIVTYILYTTSPAVVQRLQNEYIYLTTLFVILGIMRYLQITFVDENSGSPTNILLKDRFLQITTLAWAISFAWIIYL